MVPDLGKSFLDFINAVAPDLKLLPWQEEYLRNLAKARIYVESTPSLDKTEHFKHEYWGGFRRKEESPQQLCFHGLPCSLCYECRGTNAGGW